MDGAGGIGGWRPDLRAFTDCVSHDLVPTLSIRVSVCPTWALWSVCTKEEALFSPYERCCGRTAAALPCTRKRGIVGTHLVIQARSCQPGRTVGTGHQHTALAASKRAAEFCRRPKLRNGIEVLNADVNAFDRLHRFGVL